MWAVGIVSSIDQSDHGQLIYEVGHQHLVDLSQDNRGDTSSICAGWQVALALTPG